MKTQYLIGQNGSFSICLHFAVTEKHWFALVHMQNSLDRV